MKSHSLESLKMLPKKELYLVTSKLLLKKLSWAIKEIGIQKSHIILISDGEEVKNWEGLEKLLKKFSELNLDRTSTVLAFGGGTVGDIVGFATSIYLRGIKYIQIPTTLLAQVDSAHGGKTGINFLGYKNQIGSFYLPTKTIIDTRFLRSLPEEKIIDGLGEIIKAGLIKDTLILALLKKYTIKTLVKSSDLEKIIQQSIKVKEFFIRSDFTDNNLRQILNTGHTIGHALELKYKISHGRAVIYGMLQELAYTESLGLTSLSVRKNLLELLTNLGIKTDKKLKADWKTIVHDKKIIGDVITLPVIEKEGKVKLFHLDMKSFKKNFN